jgi:hypothetical protein
MNGQLEARGYSQAQALGLVWTVPVILGGARVMTDPGGGPVRV